MPFELVNRIMTMLSSALVMSLATKGFEVSTIGNVAFLIYVSAMQSFVEKQVSSGRHLFSFGKSARILGEGCGFHIVVQIQMRLTRTALAVSLEKRCHIGP
jgi:hypothetical protein